MLGGKKFIGGLALAMAMTVAVGVGVGTGVLLGSEKFTGEDGSTASSPVTPPPASEDIVPLAAEHSSHPEGEWKEFPTTRNSHTGNPDAGEDPGSGDLGDTSGGLIYEAPETGKYYVDTTTYEVEGVKYDITAMSDPISSNDVTLCLNGKELKFAADTPLEISGGNVTICDCQGTGSITYIKVTGGTLELEGGTVGSVMVESGSITVSGNAKIDNLTLPSDGVIECGELEEGASITIYDDNRDGPYIDEKSFYAANPGKEISDFFHGVTIKETVMVEFPKLEDGSYTMTYNGENLIDKIKEDIKFKRYYDEPDHNVVSSAPEYGTDYSFSLDGSSADNITDANTYTISVELTDGGKQKYKFAEEEYSSENPSREYIIHKATITIDGSNISNIPDRQYDGKTDVNIAEWSSDVFSSAVSGVADTDISNISSIIQITGAELTSPNANDSAAVDITFEITGGDNSNYQFADGFTTTSVTATMKVTKATITIDESKITVDNKKYDGNTDVKKQVHFDGAVSGIVSEDVGKVTVEIQSATLDDADVGDNKNVTIVFVITGDDNSNYQFDDQGNITKDVTSITMNVTHAPVTVTFGELSDAVYNGSDWLDELKGSSGSSSYISFSVDGFTADDYELTITAGPSKANMINAGDYTIEVTLKSDSSTAKNYELTEPATHKYTISPATVTVDWGKTEEIEFAEGLFDKIKTQIKEGIEVSTSSSSSVTITESDYTITAKEGGKSEDGEFNLTEITKAGTYTFKVTLNNTNFKFSDDSSGPVRETEQEFTVKSSVETVTAAWTTDAPTYYTSGGDLAEDILEDIKEKIEVKTQDKSETLAYNTDYTLSVNGGSEVVNENSYSVTITLTDPSKYQFDNDSKTTAELTLKVEEAVARTTVSGKTTGYGSIDEAWTAAKAASSAATVTLVKDAETATTLTVAEGDDITLNLGAQTLTASINVTGGKFALNGETEGKLLGGVSISNSGTAFTMSGGTITNTGSGVTVSGGSFTMTGGTITGCNATNGGGVYMTGGTFTMSGGTITGCNATNGGGVYMTGGTFTMSNTAKIMGNTATGATKDEGLGGGVYVTGGTFNMNGGEISENTATRGGGVYKAGSSATFTMSNGTIKNNIAKEAPESVGSSNMGAGFGGGVAVGNGTFNMNGGEISGNTAESGGGVYVEKNGKFNMSGASSKSITDNIANKKNGADVYVYQRETNNGSFTWQGGEIGTVYLGTGAFIEVQDGFTPLGGDEKITIEIQASIAESDVQVLSWTTNDPTANFKSAIEEACYYKDGRAAYIGKHSLVEGTYEWNNDYESVTFSDIHCKHDGCDKTVTTTVDATAGAPSGETCTKEGSITYKAELKLSDVSSTFPEAYATIEETISAEKTKEGGPKATASHNWTYSVSADGKSITATCTNKKHNTAVDGEDTFTITLVAPTQKTYTGKDIEATVGESTTAEPFTGKYTLTYKYKKDAAGNYAEYNDNGGKPKNAGWYKAILTAKDNPSTQATLEFEIGKATITVAGTYSDTKEYDGEVYTTEISSTGGSRGLTVDMSPIDPTFKITITTQGADAKSYTKSINISNITYDKNNFELDTSKSPTYSIFIAPRKITVTLTFTSYAYGEEPTDWVKAVASRDGSGNWYVGTSDDISILKLSYTLAGTKGGDPLASPDYPSATTPADTYTVTPHCGNGNYEVTFKDKDGGDTFQYTVNKKQLDSVNWVGETTLTYNGTERDSEKPTAKAGGVNLEVKISKFNDEDSSVAFKNAGKYTFTADLSEADKNNYDLTASNTTYDVTISPAEVTVTISGSFTYDGVVHSGNDILNIDGVTVKFEGTTTTGLSKANLTVTGEVKNYKEGGYSVGLAGSGADIIVALTGTSNYTLAANGTITVEKAELEVTTATVGSKIYDGTTTATVTDIVFSGYKGDDEGKVEVDSYKAEFASKNVGTDITVTIKELTLKGSAAGNYTPVCSKTFTASITALEVNITLSPANKTYLGTALTPTVSDAQIEVNSSIGDDLKLEVKGSGFTFTTKTDAGTYSFVTTGGSDDTIVVSINNSNFTLGTVGGTFTIDKAQIVFEKSKVSLTTEKVYDGSTSVTGVDVYGNTITFETGVNSETVNGTYTAVYNDKNVKSAKQITVTLTLKDAKNYEFGENGDNYTVIKEDGSITWTVEGKITAKALTLEPSEVSVTKVYDGNGTVKTEQITFLENALQGVVSGDTVTILSKTAEFIDDFNVGEKKSVKITITLGGDDASNYTISEQTLSVGKITAAHVKSIEWKVGDENAQNTYTYDGNSHTLTATGTWYYGDDEGGTAQTQTLTIKLNGEENGDFKDAGSYEFTAEISGNTNLVFGEGVQTSFTITVEKAVVSVGTPNTFAYNGSNRFNDFRDDILTKLTSSVTGADFRDATVTGEGGEIIEIKNVSSSPYTLTVTLSAEDAKNFMFEGGSAKDEGKSVEVQVTLTKAQVTKVEFKVDGVTDGIENYKYTTVYDGEPHTVTATVTFEGGFKEATLNKSTFQNVADGGVFTVQDSTNYDIPADVTKTLTVTIDKAKITLGTLLPADYTSEDQTSSQLNQIVTTQGDTLELNVDYTVTYAIESESYSENHAHNAGAYTVTITLKAESTKAANYTADETSTTFTVNKVGLVLSNGGNFGSKTYTGNPLTAETDGKVAGVGRDSISEDDYTVAYRLSSASPTTSNVTNAGKYIVVITPSERISKNYNAVEGTFEVEIATISSLQWFYDGDEPLQTELTYDGNTHTVTVKAQLNSGTTISLELSLSGDQNFKNVRAGGYTFIAQIPVSIAANLGELPSDHEFKLTVNKAKLNGKTVEWTGADGGEYTGLPFTNPEAEIEGVHGKLTLHIEMTSKPASAAAGEFKNAGDYTFTASLQGDDADNYDPAGVDWAKSVRITKATITVKANDKTITYGDDPKTVYSITHSELKNGEQWEDVVTGEVAFDCVYHQYDNVGGGHYTITPKKGTLEADNYDFVEFENGTLTVERKKITAKAVPNGELIYGQDIQNSNFTVTFTTLVNGDESKVTAVLTFGGTAYDGTDASGNTPPTHAGNSYTVTVTALEGDKADNYILDTAGSTATTFNIAKATVKKPTADTQTYTYNGENQTYQVQGGDAEHFEVKNNTWKDANEVGYTVTVSLRDDKNYMWEGGNSNPLEFNFKIMRKSITVNWELKDWTGDSHAFENRKFDDPTASANTGIGGEGPFTLLVERTSPATDVEFKGYGSYTFKADFDPKDGDLTKNYTLTGEIEKTYTITAATNGWKEALSLASWDYDAGTITHTPTATPIFGVGKVVFTYYSDKNGAKDNLLEKQPTDAGTYWVVATVEATNDYNGITAELSFTISPRNVAVVWDGLEKSYTYTGETLGTVGEGGNITASFTGQGDEGKIELDVTFEVDYNVLTLVTTENEFKFAGWYKFTADFKSDATLAKNNYTLSNTTQNVTVAQKNVNVVWVGDSCTYEGKVLTEKYPTATVDGKKLTVELQGDDKFMNAGTYTFEATWDPNGEIENNYNISGTTHSFEIKKAELTVSMTATVEYGEEVSENNVTITYVSGLVGDDETTGSAAFIEKIKELGFKFGEGENRYTTSTGVDQSGMLKVTVSGELTNYTIKYDTCYLTITQREVNVTLTFKNHTYGEDPNASETKWVSVGMPTRPSGKGGNWYGASDNSSISVLKISYSLKGTRGGDALTSPDYPNATTPADTYTVTATCGNRNYKVNFDYQYDESSEGYVVHKATLTGSITWSNAGKTEYSGSERTPAPTATIKGVNEETLTLDVEQTDYTGAGKGKEFKDAGTYTFTAKLQGNDANNYDWGDVEQKKQVEITPAKVTLTWDEKSYTYQGKEITDDLPTATVNDKKNNADDVTATVAPDKTFRNAEDYTFTATLTGAAAHNYVIADNNNTHKYTIEKATLNGPITWSGAESFSYDGTEHATPTATIQGVGTEDGTNGVLTLVVTPSFSGDFKNANKYNFAAKLSETDEKNYTLAGTVVTGTQVTITQAEITVKWVKESSYTYKGEKFGDITASFTGKASEGDIELTVKMTKFNDVALEAAKEFKDAGKYTFEVTIPATHQTNYKFAEGAEETLTITVEKYTVEVGAVQWEDTASERFTYTGEPLEKPTAWFNGVGEENSKTFYLEVSPTDSKTFQNVKDGPYSFKATIGKAQQQNYQLAGEVTNSYTIKQAKMEAQFGGHMSQIRDTVFHSSLTHELSLQMPDEGSDEYFLFNEKTGSKVTGLTFFYIVKTHDEGLHESESNPSEVLETLKSSGDWVLFENLDDKFKTTTETLGYTVYFKAVDEEGNYVDFYGWYGVHVATEELTITLNEKAVEAFKSSTVEYGDFHYTEAAFEELLKTGVASVTSKEDGDGTDRQNEFFGADVIQNFTFYFRQAYMEGGELKYENGHIYYFRGEGIHDRSNNSLVTNLPVGTYYLFVAYSSDKEGEKQHIVFTWHDNEGKEYRPHFTVTPREISVDVTFKNTTYGDDPDANTWVTFGTPTRVNGKSDDTWYATGEDTAASDIVKFLSITYKANGEEFKPTNKTDAKTYTVEAVCGSDNYNVTFKYTGEKTTYTVSPKEISVTITLPSDLTYGKVTAEQFTAKLTGVEDGDEVTCVLTYSGTSYDGKYNGGDTAPTQAGASYTVTATLDGEKKDNYELKVEGATETFAIKKATVNKPAEDETVYTYTGEAQTYSVESNSLYSVSGNVQTGANEGGYDVKIHLLDGDNYEWESGDSNDLTYTFIMHKATLTVTANDEEITYGDEVPKFDVTYVGFVKGENESKLGGTLGFACGYTAQYQDVGEGNYTITPSGLTSENYNIKFENGTLTVNRKSVTVTITKPSELTYGGFDPSKVFTAKLDGIVNSDPVTAKLTFSGTSYSNKVFENEPIAALKLAGSSYTVSAALEGGKAGNYILNAAGATTAAFEVKKATVAVTWSGIEESYVYQGKDAAAFALPKASATGVDGNALELTVGFAKKPNGVDEFKNAGVYQFNAKISDAELAYNYDLEGSLSGEIIVQKATVKLPEIKSKEYSGEQQQADETSFALDLYSVTENRGGIDADKYNVVLRLKEADNYKWAEGDENSDVRTLQFEITKKVIKSTDVTWEEKTYTYNGDTQTYPTAKFTGVGKDAIGDKTIALAVSLTASSKTPFKNAGTYTFKAEVANGYEENYTFDAEPTRDYTIEKAKMGETFGGTTHMPKDQRTVFRSDMEAIALKLPDPTDETFPITWANATWKDANVKIYYIVDTHSETEHNTYASKIKGYLEALEQGNLPDGFAEWAEYASDNSAMNVTDPKGYCVYFKIVDEDGNHYNYYGYFSVHIAHEELTITLTQAAREGFGQDVEYGDFTHSEETLTKLLEDGILTITSATDPSVNKQMFIDHIDQFAFYLRKDNTHDAAGNLRDDGDIYTVIGTQIYLYETTGSREVVGNLPRGTYYLYVTYVGDVNGTVQHVEFTWAGGRPSFKVVARKVTVTLTFKSHTYGDSDFSDWVQESGRTRTTKGATGDWFAPGEDKVDLNLRYALRGIGTPSATTNAGTYTVSRYALNGNYEVEFVNAAGERNLTYTIEQRVIDVTWAPYGTYTYTGSELDRPTATATGLNGDSFTLIVSVTGGGEFKNAGSYTFTAALNGSDPNVGNYKLNAVGTTSETVTVDPAEIAVVWDTLSRVYKGSAYDLPTATATGFNGDKFTLQVEMTGTGTAFEHVGSYTFTAKLDGSDPKTANYILTGIEKTYNITKAPNGWEVSPSLSGWVYDGGTAHTPNGTAQFGSVTFTYSTSETGEFTTTQPVDAGTYYLKATVAGASDYDGLTLTVQFTISPREVTVEWSAEEEYVYNGNVQTAPSASAAGVGGMKLALTITASGTFQNAGSYTFTAALSDGTNNYVLTGETLTVTIKPKEVSVTWEDKSYTYTGLEIDLPTASVTGVGSDGELTVTVALTDPSKTFRDAGSYTFLATLSGEEAQNYTLANAAKDYIIGKATLTVKAKDKEITYGDAPSNNGVTFSGFVNDEDEEVLVGTLAYSCDYEQYDDVGDYVITPSGLSADNYDIQFVAGMLKVNAKAIEVKWGAKSYTYTGSVFTDLPTATAEGIGEDGTFALKVALDDAAQTFKNAGEYVFKAELDSANAKAKNYTLTGDMRSYTVDKQTLTAPKISSKVYNGAKQTADVAASTFYTVTENNGGTKVGNYDVKLTLSDSVNYKWEGSENAEIALTFTIVAVSHDLSNVRFEDVTVKYDGKSHSLSIDGELPTGVTVTYEGNGQTDPDRYEVVAVFHDPDGVFASKTAILTILRVHAQSELEEGEEADVVLDSAEGFDPTLELVVEKMENVERSYWLWEKDEVSDKYAVRMCKGGEEIPFDGKVTVRLLIPEEFRDKDFELRTVTRSESVAFTRDGDYVVFEADGLSAYVFVCDYTPYFAVIITIVIVLFVDVLGMVALAFVYQKRKNRTEE